MHDKTTWREMLTAALDQHDESWSDVEDIRTPHAGALDQPFPRDHGGPHGPGPITLWTSRTVYQSHETEGLDHLVALPRNPAAPLDFAEITSTYAQRLIARIRLKPTTHDALDLRDTLSPLLRRLQSERMLRQDLTQQYAAALRLLSNLIETASRHAVDQNLETVCREACGDLHREAVHLTDTLSDLMQQQAIGISSPAEDAKKLSKPQIKLLRLAETRLVDANADASLKTAISLVERGLLRERPAARPMFEITSYGRQVGIVLIGLNPDRKAG
ncbi:hypothetical protein CKO28_03240 [Rhodovibrio sodomensis]|uniref:Uncharacterized protein n=1 Tax=Rhodovibrio sodomensis TaxID=1088 RepID=A0ABS1D9G0_9PROT|nr:hypothetical protein [Rhodovibrio sodomensis]MBK1667059.1 hypothetical protein [Rhodovibrio sodomensis]